ncbi:surface antigen D15 domain-containing protein [Scytonema sp. HK-05]|uniref:ShlB/FhaC/HecB family hemolysin secretion/activation protein n=1 Tax=Scytonema sp. HK-05 TaxID=1137095 RepID=UPI000AF7FB0A|nr:ShlB/FhaC/HecB family hemolysin secretion/activation protein [Scytonema sp. HK-05]BAY45651.1 surface antigen D15 domain-containing protein [Scytonema sp. HK-05]
MMLFSSWQQQPLSAQTVNTLAVPQPKVETAQTEPPSDIFNRPERENLPLVPETPPVLPPPENLLPSPPQTPPSPEGVPNAFPGTIEVERFEVIGSTVFSREQLAEVTKKFINRPITFAELLQASEAITKLYNDKDYVTSAAFLPAEQTYNLKGSVVKIQVVEGRLENIQVRGLKRLNPNYIRSRLKIATGKPLNLNRLLEALRLLQLNPLIQNISAELAAGSTPGGNVLDVTVREAKTLSAQISLDNNRNPSIGSFQRQIQLNQANLLGQGDSLSVGYANTDGSNDVEARYTYPINAYNGTLEFAYNYTDSSVIEEPFDELDIEGSSQDFALTLRQPIVQTPTEEFALGLSINRRESDVGFLESLVGRRIGFPQPGANDDGETRLSILRFFQEWTQRSSQQVLAARSQFSFGLDVFDATSNNSGPDGTFFSWRGQAQWVRLLARDTIVLLRADAQLADRPLVPLEQFGLGGQRTVRGYRQDLLLTDNAFLASAELRYPILRIPEVGGILQITPFVDYGTASNRSGNPNLEVSDLASVGVGLLWQSNNLTARFDYGIPLVYVRSRNDETLQEKGLYFSIVYTQSF